jgi:hypothetical protein
MFDKPSLPSRGHPMRLSASRAAQDGPMLQGDPDSGCGIYAANRIIAGLHDINDDVTPWRNRRKPIP